ncbi:MAG: hypothetical protein GSR84_04105 [Desulfurococcales archaeon]|nr:hypothetical protein [Desulfurococcales archaeon]
MSYSLRIVAVEDTYGVRFHDELISWLIDTGILCNSRPRIRRMPAKKCNQALYRKLVGIALAKAPNNWKILVVIDSEGRAPEEASRQDVLSHIQKRVKEHFRVAVVEPLHEAWVCLGLGGHRAICRSGKGAIRFIETTLGVRYEKRLLEKIPKMRGFTFSRLIEEHDFQAYIQSLKWLLDC